MAIFYQEGEQKKRPGLYMRYTNRGGSPVSTFSPTLPMVPETPALPEGAIESGSYASLAACLEAVESGGLVVISEDTMVNESIRVPEGKEIILHVPKGVTLSLAAGEGNYGMVIKGDVTLAGEGDIVLSGFGFGTSMNTEGKLTIKSGHYIAKGCDYIIGCFDGAVVIEGGVFDGEYCVVNNFSDHYKTDGTVKITGGVFRSQEDGFDVLGGPVEITGGTFSKAVDASYCGEGLSPMAKDDGTYTVG